MIALDREIPSSCFECPCFQVLKASDEKGKIQYLVQYCAESGEIIRKRDIEEPIPPDWIYEGRMEWCRWMEKK